MKGLYGIIVTYYWVRPLIKAAAYRFLSSVVRSKLGKGSRVGL